MVDEAIHVVAAQQEGSHHLAGVNLLARPVHHALLDQAQDAVCEHFGVHADVLVVHQLGGEGVRKGADAHLDAGAVRHQFRAVLADEYLRGGRFRKIGRHQRGVVLDEEVELVDAHQVAIGIGNVGVHHRDGAAGRFHGGDRAVYRSAQRNVAVLVRQGNLHHGHVAAQGAAPVELLRFAQVNGQVVGIAGIHICAHVRAQEEALVEENAVILRLGVGRRAFRVEVVETDIFNLSGVCPAAESLDEDMGHAGNTAQVNVVV